ncbi:MAG TPA: protein kinase [Actinomycetes bacterium]|nr:protein kinase [Actinomycetes bacterium]
MAVATPTILAGRYELGRQLGTGGMAEVFQGRDLLLARPVAVKVLHPRLTDDPAFLARFWREAQAAASVNHPNVVAVYDFDEHAGRSFLVLEYVPGPSLARVLRGGPLPPERVVALGTQVCAALDAAHRRGVVHRDVKPGNLLLGPDGVLKVTDFGIAHAAGVADDLTDPGAVLGSVRYMAPEQLAGEAADHRADLYALGVCLYELLAGHAPFKGDSQVAVANGHLHDRPRSLTRLRPEVPRGLADAVARALSKRPEERQASARQLGAELQRAPAPPRRGPVSAWRHRPARDTVPLHARPAPAWPRRRSGRAVLLGWLAVVCLAVGVLLTGGALTDLVQPPTDGPPDTTAPRQRGTLTPAPPRVGAAAGSTQQRREAARTTGEPDGTPARDAVARYGGRSGSGGGERGGRHERDKGDKAKDGGRR